MYPIETSDHDGVTLEEYQGKYYLVSYYLKNGTFYMRWAKYQVGKDMFSEKPIPVKVMLGDKKTALEVLKYFIDQLDPQQPVAPVVEDDVPF